MAFAAAAVAGCGRDTTTTQVEFSHVGTIQFEIGRDGSPQGILARSSVGAPGEVWVAQHFGPIRRVARYTADGKPLGELHLLPDSVGAELRTMSAGPDGTTWFVQQDFSLLSGSIVVLGGAGASIQTIPLGSGYNPLGIASAEGLTFVSESAREATAGPLRCHIKVFDRDGNLVRVFGNSGPAPLTGPRGLAATDSSVWVCDANRLLLYRPDGRLVRSLGPGAAPTPNGWEPSEVAITSDGRLLVADAANHVVDEFQLDGKFVGKIDRETVGGDIWFQPRFIACQPDGKGGDYIYISSPQDLGLEHVHILSRRKITLRNNSGVLRPQPGS